MEPLKLLALDGEDLAILSANLQDAVVKVGDLGFLPREQRFALLLNRFDWDHMVTAGQMVRRRSGLHFERVRNVRSRGFDRNDTNLVLNLLAITFAPGDVPSGELCLTFSGGGEIRLDVECIEARLTDLGPAWGCSKAPQHEADSLAKGAKSANGGSAAL